LKLHAEGGDIPRDDGKVRRRRKMIVKTKEHCGCSKKKKGEMIRDMAVLSEMLEEKGRKEITGPEALS